jgi:hypothetical protein
MKEKSLGKCTVPFLEDTFNLNQIQESLVLTHWLTTDYTLSEFEKAYLEALQANLSFNLQSWNEYELLSHFIGPILGMVGFSSRQFNLFGERDLEAVVQGATEDWRLFGKPDGMVASGRRVPKQPYFAFQEYKREKDPDGDPTAQALAAMLAGRALNSNKRPMYGCYIVGEKWNFMVLEGQDYAVSHGFSALGNDLFFIFRVLKKLKQYVIQFVAEDSLNSITPS